MLGWLLLAGQALAQGTDPAIQKGLAWLQGQIGSNGQLASEAASIATPFQARQETQVTLAVLANAPGALAANVAANTDTNVEYTARRIIAAGSAAQAADITLLLAAQNADGGWGADPDHQSNALDTAFALQALAAANSAELSVVANALTWLTQAKLADGGWGVNGQSSVYVTSNVLLGVNAWLRQYMVASITSAASTWLLGQRDAATQTYAITLDNALALRALATQTAQDAVLQPLAAALDASQLANGSWAGDPYLTALALRALAFAVQPPSSPTEAALGGVIRDSNGNPLQSVTVTVGAALTVTDATGAYQITGLSPGVATVTASLSGYQMVTANITLVAGPGNLFSPTLYAIGVTPPAASLQGVVVNAAGAAIPSASVALGGGVTVATDADGKFAFTNQAAGAFALTISTTGYASVTVTGSLVAGVNDVGKITLPPPPPLPTTGDMRGKVVDQSTGLPIAGATVQLVENSSSASTASDGRFAFGGVAPGAYTLRASALGYRAASGSVPVVAGQVTDLGSIALAPAPLTAALSGVVKNSSGNSLANVIVAVGTASTFTDATGAYQITGLSPGAATITATLSGYQTATASVTFVAGNSYLFSPTMYATNVTPPATSLRGTVVDGATGAALANANVMLNGATAVVTAANGQFTFTNQSAGAFTLTVSATGYTGITATGSMVTGVNDVGKIALSVAPVASTLSGLVTDADTHAPIASASIAVSGQGLTGTTDANGKYSITDISGSTLTLYVSAPGYLTQTLQVTLPQAGNATLDIQLTKPAAAGISFDSVQMSQPGYAPNAEAVLNVRIRNQAANAAALVVLAQVFDAQQNVAFVFQGNVRGAGQNPPNLPLIVPANGALDVPMEQLMLRQAAGSYTVHVQAIDTAGRVVAEGDTQFSVTAEAILAGGLIPDPPLAQVGTQQPIALSADLTDTGNQPIAAGDLQLSITLRNADTQALASVQTAASTLVSGAPLNNAQGLVTDAAGNLYTVNMGDGKLLKLDPSGVSTVLATLPTNSQATSLALDAQGNFWIGANNGGKLYQVNPQGVISTLTLSSLNSVAGIDVDASGNLLITGTLSTAASGGSGLISRTPAGQETVLLRNGLSSPYAMVKDDAGNYVVTNYGDNTVSKVLAATGAVSVFATGLNRPEGITRDAQGNFYVANYGNNTVAKITPDGQVSTYASGLNQPFDLKFAPNGDLYVSNQGNSTIVKVLPGGAVQLFAQGIAKNPQGMKYDSAGNLWIANDDGTLRVKDTQDEVTAVATGLSAPRGLAIDAGGGVLVANYSNGQITRTAGADTTAFATGLSSPYGVAADDSGTVYVTEYGARRITYFDGSGNKLGVIDSLLNSPAQVRAGAGGEIYVRNSDSILKVQNGVAQFLVQNFTASYIAPDPVGGGVVAATGSVVWRVAANGATTRINATNLPFTNYGVGVDAAGTIILLDYSGKLIRKIDDAGNLSSLAALPENAQTLVTDLAGNIYVRGNSGALYAVSDAGVVTQIPVATMSGSVYGINNAADGSLLAWTNSNYVYAIDPVTGAATQVASGFGINVPVARDASGAFYVADSGNQELRTYASGGSLQTALAGFINPRDIVWTGADLRFVDVGNRLYSLVPGGYPTKLGTFTANYLAAAQGQLYGGNSNTITAWSGTAAQTWTTLPGMTFNGGIAARGDGAITAADNAASRVVTFNASKALLNDFAGIVTPEGLAFDAQGRLYVANNGSGIIGRFDLSGGAGITVAKTSAPMFLSFDGAGNLYASRSSEVDAISSAGVVTTFASASGFTLYGFMFDGAQLIGAGATGQLRKWNATGWSILASGLSNPMGVRIAGNDVYIANYGNAMVVKYSNGALSVVGSLPSVRSIDMFPDGNVYAGGNSGLLYRIAPDGTQTDMGVSHVINSLSVYGIAPGAGNSEMYLLTYGSVGDVTASNIVKIGVIQTAAPPPAGTVVYTAAVPMPALPAVEDFTHIDLGQWLPPYGGDFQIDVSRPGVQGGATNFVHVGAAVTGALSESESQLPPGDQTLSMCMRINGADFTSISRVETAQVKPMVTIAGPNGLAGNRTGDVFFTDTGNLYKVDQSGVQTQILGGLSTSFGLSADDGENMYLASRNATTGRFDLIKVSPQGVKTVIADLGVTSANGVQVDSHGNVLVGSPGRLLRVDAQGNVSTVTTLGLPQPRGIAIDGKDNVYVQNENHYVSMIRTDGTVTDIFTKGDGVIDPWFEGDGYPNIAADCADNFYVAVFTWQKLGVGVQNSEEHTLAQVIPRTGQISLLLDTLKISSSLNDVDYLAYDRLGSRLLMWNDGYPGTIWQAPVTCGAISVQAHLVTAPGQTITGMSAPSSAAIPQANGGAEYVWSLKDVTTSGQQICFDTNLDRLQLGELRKSLDSGFITFQNSFAPNDVKVPLDIPWVQVTNLVQMGVATDQPDYPANATAQITTTLTNPNPYPVSGMLTVDVVDASGVRVGNVTQQGVSIAPGGNLPVGGLFPIGAILPAQSTVTAVLADNGAEMARASTAFNVLPNNQSASATSTVATDRYAYNPSDRVTISSRALSQSSNLILNNLTLMVQVVDAGAAVQFTHGYPIAQLLPGGQLDFSVQQPLLNAPAGIYTVKQDLLDDQQRAFNHVETTYQVGSTRGTGFGLTGTIAATPKTVRPGETLGLAASAANQGNDDLAGLPLTIYLIDPVLGTVAAQFDQTSDIAAGASAPFNTTWITQGRVGATYLAVLVAQIGSGASATNVTLAQDSFQIQAPIAAGIQATGGTPQSATNLQPYPVALQATVRDTASQVIPGITVTFAAPAAGASVTFPNGNTAVTDADGNAVVTVTANATAGAFVVTASAPGVTGAAAFNLQNLDPVAATIIASGGTPQTAAAGSAYAQPLQALVQDDHGLPVPAVTVTFAAPATGASVTFPGGNVAVTDASGHASVLVIANGSAGDFTVTATAVNVPGSALFALSNTVATARPTAIPALGAPALALMGFLMGLMALAASRTRRRTTTPNTQTTR
ncbi:MAG: carboxypeptidase regulatory-like domain-containing protein [Burkholderiaceae bacterium]|nr:carboxypeptidase regulatory-like domain-containing protein [Burkholderiaceae bacterium]